MQISDLNTTRCCPEQDIYNTLLQLDGKNILELGCGKADITRSIATAGTNRHMMALEVDEIQHRHHQNITDLPNVTFIKAGAEQIPCPDNTIDVVLMFKSLHHVPVELMDQALLEIHRVLQPGGIAYISEPVFAGDFNDLLKIFHDEETVRLAAFNAVKQSVDSGLFSLKQQCFFNAPMHFDNFADFERKVLNVTHTDHNLCDDLYTKVKQQFALRMSENGAHFQMPLRIDLLCKAHAVST